MAETTTPPAEALTLPPEVAEELIRYGLQTQPGQALWRGFLLGSGLPKGQGQVKVERASYMPAPAKPEGGA